MVVVLDYLAWHYTQSFADFWRNAKNITAFFARYFSFHALLANLFNPWREYTGENTFLYVVYNLLLTALGFFIRLFLLLVGVAVLASVILTAVVVLIAWVFMPLIAFIMFVLGTYLIFA